MGDGRRMSTGDVSDANARDPEARPESPVDEKPSLRTLRGAYAGVLPDATFQDFMDIKKIWEPRMPPDE